jgi:hypothetical protein
MLLCHRFVGLQPLYCPNKGPHASFDLAPGTYQVVIRAVDSPHITPWSGTWVLKGGTRYTAGCIFIVSHSW